MAKVDRSYHRLLRKIVKRGYKYEDPNRKGVNRLEVLSHTFRHSFDHGFPAITTKKLSYHNVVAELIWFLRGDTNIKYLLDNGCNIWNKDAYNHFKKVVGPTNITMVEFIEGINQGRISDGPEFVWGDLGPVYGHQWRNFNGIDQFRNLINNLKDKPLGTEHIVNSWNVSDIAGMALPPCHYGYQIIVKPIKDLSWYEYEFELHWSQRSVDTFLGLPYNIASYAILALIIEAATGYRASAIQGDLKKVHLYENSLDAVDKQLQVSVDLHDGPCWLNVAKLYKRDWTKLDEAINSLTIDDFILEGYSSEEAIIVPMLGRD